MVKKFGEWKVTEYGERIDYKNPSSRVNILIHKNGDFTLVHADAKESKEVDQDEKGCGKSMTYQNGHERGNYKCGTVLQNPTELLLCDYCRGKRDGHP